MFNRDFQGVVAWCGFQKWKLNHFTRFGLTVLLLIFCASAHGAGTGFVVEWGEPVPGSGAFPRGVTNISAVAAGYAHDLALKDDGTVIAWGDSYGGATAIPAGLSNVVAISAGNSHSLALLQNGSVVAWGGTNYVVPLNPPSGLSNIVAISAGDMHSVALKADGRVVAWGFNDYGQTNVPSGLSNVTAIAAGGYHSLALKSDGTVMGWGNNESGQAQVPGNLSNIVAVAAGRSRSLALKSDGTVAAWGYNDYGGTSIPSGLSNVTAIAAGDYHTLALISDGTIVAWGSYIYYGQTNVPSGLSNAVAIAAGGDRSLALVSSSAFYDPTVRIDRHPQSLTAPVDMAVTFEVVASGGYPLSYQWFFNGQELTVYDHNYGVNDASLTIWDARPADAGNYSVVVSNAYGFATSSNAVLFLLYPPVITKQPTNQTVSKGTNVTFSVTATSLSPLGYQWKFKGTNIVEATSSMLLLTNVQPGFAGIYSVVVSNSDGSVQSANATLTVTSSPPVIISHSLTNQNVPIGGSAKFSVTAKGSLPLQYQWYFNGAEIANATNSILSLQNLRLDQTGYYSAGIRNPDGEIVSVKAFLSVSQAVIWSGGRILTNDFSQFDSLVAIKYQYGNLLGLKADGRVTESFKPFSSYSTPAGLVNVQAIAAGGQQKFALKDGAVFTWAGSNTNLSLISGLTDIVAIDAIGSSYYLGNALALRSDGTIFRLSGSYATLVSGLSNAVGIAAGSSHGLALKRDGTVMSWNANSGSFNTNVPPGLTNVIAIAANQSSLALLANGTVVAWGGGQTNVPSSLTNVVAIAAGIDGNLALRADGQIVSWNSPTNVPAGLSNVVFISGGNYFGALVGNGSPVLTIQPVSQIKSKSSRIELHARAAGIQPMNYQWQLNGANLAGATNADLVITSFQQGDVGDYRAIVSNSIGFATGLTAHLSLSPPISTPSIPLNIALNATNLVWTAVSTNSPWFGQLNETHDNYAAAQSGAITNNQQSILQTTVTGPGTLTFWWKVSSEPGYDFLKFSGGSFEPPVSISGEKDWQQKTFSISPGSHTLQWSYTKDGTVSSGADAGWVDEVVFMPPPPVIYQQAIGKTALAGSNFTLSVLATGVGPLTYQWFKDLLSLSNATQATLALTNVTRLDSGLYSVRISNAGGVIFSSNAVINIRAPQRLQSFQRAADGTFSFLFGDADGGLLASGNLPSFEIQFTSDFLQWTVLPEAPVLTNGLLLFQDADSTNHPARFYRVIEH